MKGTFASEFRAKARSRKLGFATATSDFGRANGKAQATALHSIDRVQNSDRADMRRHPNRESFERFYLTKVALGEGCGCAEHATRLRDLEARSHGLVAGRSRPSALRAILLLPLARLLLGAARWARSGSA